MHDQRLYERLKAKTEVDANGCWIWQGLGWYKRKWPQNRYGMTHMSKPYPVRTIGAHRAMLIAMVGPLRKDQCACHRCDVPRCINPAHLFVGSMRDNIHDSRSKNRHHEAQKTHCLRGHPLSGDNVRISKQAKGKSGFARQCKSCQIGYGRLRHGWPEDLAWDMSIRVPFGYRIDFNTRQLVHAGRRSHHSANPEQK